MNTRRVAATVLAAALLVPALIGATRILGWGTDTGSGGSRDAGTDGADGRRVLRDFAAAMQDAGDHTFTARYATGRGAVVVHAQEPPRRAYRSAAGLYLAGPDATYLCRIPGSGRASCERTAGTDSVPLGHARALMGVLDGDFIAPELVSAYISRLAARPTGRVDRSQRVIADQPVSCVAVAKLFSACTTSTGILAYFEAPEGRLTLTGYRAGATAEFFSIPAGALISDTTAPG